MKAVKLLLAALAMTFAMSSNAQIEGRFTLDVKGGVITPGSQGAFGVGFGYQVDLKQFGDWNLAWDVANIEFAAPFDSPKNLDLLALKSGLRLFTPTFWGDKWRAYTNLGVGYSCALQKVYELGGYYDPYTGMFIPTTENDKMEANHGFGLTFGAGLQFNQKWSFGYTLQYETALKTKSHFGTIGIAF
jgi:hypothetical protein